MPRNHQRGQQALATLVGPPVRQAFGQFVNLDDLAGSLPPFKAATSAVVGHYGRASSAAALTFYRGARTRAGITGRPALRPVLPDSDRLDSSLSWATAPLWTPDAASFVDDVLERLIGTAERYVLNAGRDTLLGAVAADPKASGWARVAEGDACAFCAMLTTAGAHYKSEDSGSFEAHDHCACSVEPVFENQDYKPDARVQAWDDLYVESTGGLHGDDALNAFRRAFDGEGNP